MNRPEFSSRRIVSTSEGETERLGAELAATLSRDALVLLEGNLGTGKTVLVRGIGRALGIDPREIQSPTYNLIHEHEGEHGRLVHVDLYRLEGDEIAALGLEEILDGEGIKAVEWAERLHDWPVGSAVDMGTVDAGTVGTGTVDTGTVNTVRIRLQRLAPDEHEIVIETPSA